MKIIIGLGNLGEKYKNNRHNIGFMVLDKLNDKNWQKSKSNLLLYSWLNSSTELVKPQTFMNESGVAVKYAVNKHKIKTADLYIIHDDLDIPLGSYKIQLGVGPKVHNGINSVEDAIGTKDFWRIRIGVDNRDPNDRAQGEEYVLQDFTNEDREILDGVIKKVCKEISHLFK